MIELRDFIEADENALIEILNDSQVVQFLSTKIPSPYTSDDAKWWISQGSRSANAQAICLNDRLIGCIGVTPGQFEYQRSGEIGYWLARQHWRKGITSEAIRQMTQKVFNETNIVRIFGCVFADNQNSKKVLLKTGFQAEAVLKNAIFKDGQFYDNHVFALLKPSF